MAKWIVAEQTKAGLRHAVVCPNLTGRTKERIAQSKRARAGSLALVDYCSHKWHELISSRRLVCRCQGVFSLVLRLFCSASFFVSMVSLKPRPLSFNRPSICRRSDSHTCCFFFFGDVAFSEYFFGTISAFSLYGLYGL